MSEKILIKARAPEVLLPEAFQGSADWEGLSECCIAIADGKVASVAKEAVPGAEIDHDLSGSILLPGFLDAHTHLDKAHSWDRAPNVSGTFAEALKNLSEDKENWTEEDVYQRANYALKCAYAYGTVGIRTHVDTGLPWAERSYKALSRLKSEWAGKIELQMVSLCSVSDYATDSGPALADLPLAYGASAIGGMPLMNPDLDQQLDALMALAKERDVGLDLHVDESGNPDASCLKAVAEAKMRNDFDYPVVCGHCCSLAVKPLEEQLETIDLVVKSGIRVVSLPMCNLYLQDRRGAEDGIQTPYWRGITLAHEFLDRGVAFACASDNVRDAFYAFGDLDMLEVYRESVRIGHLDRRLSESVSVATSQPAQLMDLEGEGYGMIAPGSPARFTQFHVESFSKLLSRPHAERSLFRDDRFHAFALPDYSELGPLHGV